MSDARRVLADAAPALVLTLPLPPLRLHPNHAMNRGPGRTKLVRQARRDAMLAAYNDRPVRPFAACEARITVHLENLRRPMDGDNILAWCKNQIDGLTDAQIWVDDAVVQWLPARVAPCAKGEQPHVTVFVWPADAGGTGGQG